MPLLPLGVYAIWWPALTHFTVDGFATTRVRPCANSTTNCPCSTTASAPTSTSTTPTWTASSSSTATVPSTPAPWHDAPGCTPPPSPASWTGSNAAAGSPASVTQATVAPSSSAPWATATPSCSVSSRDEHRDGPALRQLRRRRAPTARRLPPPHHQRRTNRHRPAGQRLRQQPRPVPHRRGSEAGLGGGGGVLGARPTARCRPAGEGYAYVLRRVQRRRM